MTHWGTSCKTSMRSHMWQLQSLPQIHYFICTSGICTTLHLLCQLAHVQFVYTFTCLLYTTLHVCILLLCIICLTPLTPMIILYHTHTLTALAHHTFHSIAICLACIVCNPMHCDPLFPQLLCTTTLENHCWLDKCPTDATLILYFCNSSVQPL